jgi:hypothetical protein
MDKSIAIARWVDERMQLRFCPAALSKLYAHPRMSGRLRLVTRRELLVRTSQVSLSVSGLCFRGTSPRIRIRIAVDVGRDAPEGVWQSRIPSDMSAPNLGPSYMYEFHRRLSCRQHLERHTRRLVLAACNVKEGK